MSKYFLHRKRLEKWTVTVLFKALVCSALSPEVMYSLRYDRGYKQQNRGATKPVKVQYGSVVWGHTATFLCSLLPKKDSTYEKKLLTLEVHEHVAAVRMGRMVGKDINIDLAKYLYTPDREYCFPIQITKTDVAQLHLVIRARKTDPGAFPTAGYDTEDGTDTNPGSRRSTVSALSDMSDNHSDNERTDFADASASSLNKSELDALQNGKVVAELNGTLTSFVRRSGVQTPSDISYRSSCSRRSAKECGLQGNTDHQLRAGPGGRVPSVSAPPLALAFPSGPSPHSKVGSRALQAQGCRLQDYSQASPLRREEEAEIKELRARIKELEAELRGSIPTLQDQVSRSCASPSFMGTPSSSRPWGLLG
eukprot:GGOE01006910.1.p1 GENE.GGOE01006910.1~~GGOE01006910.1.p1  ORF type:complete len:365 (-),score=48.07 GGOE01006910.1:489-1583(-)